MNRCRVMMPALLRGDFEQATRQLYAPQKA